MDGNDDAKREAEMRRIAQSCASEKQPCPETGPEFLFRLLDHERAKSEGLRKLVAFDEAVAQVYTELIAGVEAIDSVDGSQNWWMFADKARAHVVKCLAAANRRAKDAALSASPSPTPQPGEV